MRDTSAVGSGTIRGDMGQYVSSSSGAYLRKCNIASQLHNVSVKGLIPALVPGAVYQFQISQSFLFNLWQKY